jgi:hypothetical protein
MPALGGMVTINARGWFDGRAIAAVRCADIYLKRSNRVGRI